MLFTSHGVTTGHWQLEDAAEAARTFTIYKGITTKCLTINNNKRFSASVYVYVSDYICLSIIFKINITVI